MYSWLRQPGAMLVFLSLLASSAFGLFDHYLVDSHDNIASIPAGEWQVAFIASAFLIAVSEFLGAVAAALTWIRAR